MLQGRSGLLLPRVTYTAESATVYILYRLLFGGPPSVELSPSQLMHMWTLNVLPQYEHLTIPNLQAHAHDTMVFWIKDGVKDFLSQLICNMSYFNRLLAGSNNVLDCECDTVGCCIDGMMCDEIPPGTVDVDVDDYGEEYGQGGLVTRSNNRELEPDLPDGLDFKFYGRAVRICWNDISHSKSITSIASNLPEWLCQDIPPKKIDIRSDISVPLHKVVVTFAKMSSC